MNETKPTRSENEMVALLEKFKPKPSDGFYRRMARAPWKTSSELPARAGAPTAPTFLRRLSFVFLALAILVGFVSFTPAGQAVAQKVLQFFLPAEGDVLTVSLNGTATSQARTLNSPDHFPLSISQAQSKVAFKLKKIPAGILTVHFSGAQYDPLLKSVTLSYTGDGFTLLLTQRPAGAVTEYSTIGATAPIEWVNIGSLQGEYVSGGWRLRPNTLPNTSEGTLPAQSQINVFWDPTLPQQTLRWQVGDTIYEFLTLGRYSPDKNTLIQAAESLR